MLQGYVFKPIRGERLNPPLPLPATDVAGTAAAFSRNRAGRPVRVGKFLPYGFL